MGPADDVDTDFVASEARRHPAIEDFVLWLTVERGRSSNTLAAYGRDLARYQAHLARRGVDPLTATDEDVLAFVHVLQGEGLAPSSVTRTLVAVRGLHRFLVADEIRTDDPAADIEIPPIPKGLPKALTLDQVGIHTRRDKEPRESLHSGRKRRRVHLEVIIGTREGGKCILRATGSRDRFLILTRIRKLVGAQKQHVFQKMRKPWPLGWVVPTANSDLQ